MCKCLAFIAVLLALTARCLTIEMQVIGDATNITNRTEFCVGEIMTLVCSYRYSTIEYVWQVPASLYGNHFRVSQFGRMSTLDGMNATYVSKNESTLVFVASVNLNGANIRCFDGVPRGGSFISSTTLQLHSDPLPPMVNSSQDRNNASHLNVAITPTGDSAICVRQYRVTLSYTDLPIQQLSRIVRTMEAVSGSTTVKLDELRLCRSNYIVSVVAIDINNSMGELSKDTPGDVSPEDENFTTTVNDDELIITVPVYYDSCIDGYEYIFDNCEGFFSESPYRVSLTRFDRTGCRNCTLFLSPVFDANTPNVNTSFRVDIHLNETPETPECQCLSNTGALIGVTIVAVIIFVILLLIIVLLLLKLRSIEQSVSKSDHKTSTGNDDIANLETQSQKQSATDKDKETNIGMVNCLAYGTVTSTRSTAPTNVGAGIYEAV